MKNSRNHDNAHAIQRTPVQYEKPRPPTVTACQPPDSEIQSLMNTQESNISHLQEVISRLRDRLSSILIPCPIEDQCGGATPTGSALGSGLNTHNGRIADASDQLNAIINQLAI